jgi:hypothetical protein
MHKKKKKSLIMRRCNHYCTKRTITWDVPVWCIGNIALLVSLVSNTDALLDGMIRDLDCTKSKKTLLNDNISDLHRTWYKQILKMIAYRCKQPLNKICLFDKQLRLFQLAVPKARRFLYIWELNCTEVCFDISLRGTKQDYHCLEQLKKLHLVIACANCNVLSTRETKHKKCGRCYLSHYCSDSCQLSHWSEHQVLCNCQLWHRLPKACGFCRELLPRRQRQHRQLCRGCRRVYYCSKECQVNDWSFHKANCS